MLELDKLHFSYPEHKFDLSLKVATGARLALQGPSGIGKTTVLNLIAGLLEPESGLLLWNNTSLLSLNGDQRPISYLFQSHNIFEHLSAYDNIMLAIYSFPKSKRMEQHQKLKIIIHHCGLEDIIHKKTSLLSGGQKQRVALARFMGQGQKIGLLDEPFNGLDRDSKKFMMDIVVRWQHETKTTLIFTSHHRHEIKSFATISAQLKYNDNIVYLV